MKQINHDVTTIDEVLTKLKDLNYTLALTRIFYAWRNPVAFAASRTNAITWWFHYRDIPLARIFLI